MAAVVVDLGSDTITAGLAQYFLGPEQPYVVRHLPAHSRSSGCLSSTKHSLTIQRNTITFLHVPCLRYAFADHALATALQSLEERSKVLIHFILMVHCTDVVIADYSIMGG